MALDATVGGSASDSYVTLAAADAYFAARFSSDAWEDASDSDQEKALRQAARNIGRFRFVGYRSSPSQALAFPRAYPYNDDPERQSATLAIPQSIKDAQCEEAIALLQAVADPGGDAAARRAALQAQGVTSFSTLGLSETYSSLAYQPGSQPISSAAYALLVRWISQTGQIDLDRPTAHGVVVNQAEPGL